MRLPTVLRSRLTLLGQQESSVGSSSLPLVLRGTTYTMAQEATALDEEHFAVGRWDGSLHIYRFDPAREAGPLISKAVNCPADEGVQMILGLDPQSIATSNDQESIAIWTCPGRGNWSDLELAGQLRFDASWGVVNSGALARLNIGCCFLAGHANGFIAIWHGAGLTWRLLSSIDARANTPLNPWGLHNIRGIEIIGLSDTAGIAVCGSEDADLTVFEFPSGRVLTKTPYNSKAQRGINALAFHAGLLLVANCAVGASDRNLWAYRIDPVSGQITLTDAVNLAIDSGALQVFNFDVIWGAEYRGTPTFFASTEEGVLWMGSSTSSGRLEIAGNLPVTYAPGSQQLLHLGSGICSRGNRIAVAGYDVAQIDIAASSLIEAIKAQDTVNNREKKNG